MAAPVRIRPATAQDWPGIWPIIHAVLVAGESYSYPSTFTAAQAHEVWMLHEPWHTVVAELDGQIAGTAIYGPNRPGRGSHVATASFMVSPQASGRGIGRALGEYVVDAAAAQGYAAMQFNAVVETNTAAVMLWRALGFEILTTVPAAFEHATRGRVGLHIMYRTLS